jgi:superfamily II DNA or RNA helicase
MAFELRPYQRAAIDACFDAWGSGRRRIAIQLPTGAGKTVVFCRLTREARAARGSGTTLVLAHLDKLVGQAAEKFRADDPDLRVGICKAEQNEVHDVDVIVGSVQTLCRQKRLDQLPEIDLVIVDEAHHAASKSYVKILRHLGCYDDGAWLLGVSATLERNDSRKLSEVFEQVVYQVDVLDLIPEYLVEPRAKAIEVRDFDLSKVSVRAGDLADKDLAAALDRSGAYGVVAASLRRHAPDRPTVVFTPNIDTAEKMAGVLSEWGFTAECISSRTASEDRISILKRYDEGDVQVLVNCAVLIEGWDAPPTSCVVIARPTVSRILFSQMVGRGLRLHAGKEDCLVLDLVGVSGRHRLSTIADLTAYEVEAPKDGETLTQARERKVHNKKATARTSGSLSSRDIDLLRRATGSSVRDGWWLISAGGVRFLEIRDEDDAKGLLWIERVDGFDHVVMWAPLGASPECLEAGLTWEQAEGYARAEARSRAGIKAYIDPRARWRRQEPSPGQIGMAQRLEIDLEDSPSRGELSDRISVCVTGPRIDRWIEQNRGEDVLVPA